MKEERIMAPDEFLYEYKQRTTRKLNELKQENEIMTKQLKQATDTIKVIEQEKNALARDNVKILQKNVILKKENERLKSENAKIKYF